MHGFKVGWYLDVSNETRRLMWRLAHAHGVLLGVVNVLFAFTLRGRDGPERWHAVASPCLLGASVLLPGGFFLGGIVVYGGDPGLGIFLVPAGALLLFVGVALTAYKLTARAGSAGASPAGGAKGGPAPEKGKGSKGRRD